MSAFSDALSSIKCKLEKFMHDSQRYFSFFSVSRKRMNFNYFWITNEVNVHVLAAFSLPSRSALSDYNSLPITRKKHLRKGSRAAWWWNRQNLREGYDIILHGDRLSYAANACSSKLKGWVRQMMRKLLYLFFRYFLRRAIMLPATAKCGIQPSLMFASEPSLHH